MVDNNYTIKKIVFSPTFDVDHTIYFVADEAILRSMNGGHTCEIIKRVIGYDRNIEYMYYKEK